MKLYRARKNSDGIQFIDINVDNNIVVTTWGLLGSNNTQMTEFVAEPKNLGKSNEVTSIEQARLIMQKYVKRAKDCGYVDSICEAKNRNTNSELLTLDDLPKQFCPSKPISNTPEDVLNDKNILAQIKYNGVCLILVKTDTGIHIYSRRMENYDKLVIIPEISKICLEMPIGSMLIGEFIAINKEAYREETRVVGSVTRTKKKEEILEKYNTYSRTHTFKLCIFDILFHNNMFCGNIDFLDRYQLLKDINILPPHIFNYDKYRLLKNDDDYRNNHEGFILRYPRGSKSYVGYSLNGTAERKGAYKDKFTRTEYFYVLKADYGTGKFTTIYSKFHLYQKRGVDDFYCGNAGPGNIKHDELIQLSKNIENNAITLPFVVLVEYRDRQDSGKLEHPVIKEICPLKFMPLCTVIF